MPFLHMRGLAVGIFPEEVHMLTKLLTTPKDTRLLRHLKKRGWAVIQSDRDLRAFFGRLEKAMANTLNTTYTVFPSGSNPQVWSRRSFLKRMREGADLPAL